MINSSEIFAAFVGVLILFGVGASAFFINKWTDNLHEFRMECLAHGGDVFRGTSCNLQEEPANE